MCGCFRSSSPHLASFWYSIMSLCDTIVILIAQLSFASLRRVEKQTADAGCVRVIVVGMDPSGRVVLPTHGILRLTLAIPLVSDRNLRSMLALVLSDWDSSARQF
jgi:hypothetical protein